MAAEYTKFSLEDIEKFLMRGFRAMRPKRGEDREIYFDLKLSSKAFVRVWTSIYPGQTEVRGKELRPIRVQLLAGHVLSKGRPLTAGKAPIVKRTQGWKATLQERIEDYIELFEDGYAKYHDDDDGHDHSTMPADGPGTGAPVPKQEPEVAEEPLKTAEPAGEPPKGDLPKKPSYAAYPPSDKQIKFLKSLISEAFNKGLWAQIAEEFNLPADRKPDNDDLKTLSGGGKGTASKLIDALKEYGLGQWYGGGGGGGGYRRWADDSSSPAYDYNRVLKIAEVETGYWTDADVRHTIERTPAGRFRLADMQTAWRDEVGSFEEARESLSKYANRTVVV